MKMRYILVAVLAAAMSSCASVPSAVFVNTDLSTDGVGKHMVTVERGSNVGANRAPLNIYVNETLAAKLYGNQAVNLYLPSGRHRIGVAMNNVGVFGHGESGADRTITIDVSASSNPILRASPVGGVLPTWQIERSD